MIDNRRDAENQIADIIEAGDARADEFDIEAIADACYDRIGSWDIDALDHDDFWQIVAQYAK